MMSKYRKSLKHPREAREESQQWSRTSSIKRPPPFQLGTMVSRDKKIIWISMQMESKVNQARVISPKPSITKVFTLLKITSSVNPKATTPTPWNHLHTSIFQWNRRLVCRAFIRMRHLTSPTLSKRPRNTRISHKRTLLKWILIKEGRAWNQQSTSKASTPELHLRKRTRISKYMKIKARSSTSQMKIRMSTLAHLFMDKRIVLIKESTNPSTMKTTMWKPLTLWRTAAPVTAMHMVWKAPLLN